MIKSSIGKGANQRRSAIGFPNSNSSITDSKGRQIYDRGKSNDTDGMNSTKPADKRKHTVLRITVIKHSRNQTTGQSKVLSVGNKLKDVNTALRTSPQRAAQDILQDTKVPLTFRVNTKTSNEENTPINKLLSDKPLPNDKHDSNAGIVLEHPKTSPEQGIADSAAENAPKSQDKLESNVVLEAKLNPLRIGIRLNDDKKQEAQQTSEEVDHISLQDVLKDIDDSSKTGNATGDQSNPEKENSVVIDLNDDSSKGNKSITKQEKIHENDEKQGKLLLQATNHKDNKNGTEVQTAGVSITTESKGLHSDNLMKVLLSKLLGSDISEALKGKVQEELKSASSLKRPDDNGQKQRPIHRPLDEASTAATGSLLESPPGTVQAVDNAEMNNAGPGPTAASPSLPAPMPSPVPTPAPLPPPAVAPGHPNCIGGPLPLFNPAGDRVDGNAPPPGGRDCSNGLQRLPLAQQVASTYPTGMLLESAPGTQQAVDTGIPSPAPIPPRPPPRLPYNGGSLASTTAAGQGVESPPGTIMAVGTSASTGTRINAMRGDNGKKKW